MKIILWLTVITLWLVINPFTLADGLSTDKPHLTFIKKIKCAHLPKDLIYSPDGKYLMITPLADDGIQILDTATGELKKVEIKQFGKYADFVEGVFSPDGSEFWFTQTLDIGRVFVLSMKDFKIKKIIKTQGKWSKVGEFTPDGSLYYVSNWLSDSVTVIDPKLYEVKHVIPLNAKEPRGIGFSEDGKYLYVVYYRSGEIHKLDALTGKVIKTIRNGGTNGRFRIDRKLGIVYINNMHHNKVYIYDLKQDAIVRELNTWINPNNVKLSADGRFVYVSNRGPNNTNSYELRSPVNGRVMVFDRDKDYQVIQTLKVGNQPIGLAISPDNKTLAISNFMDDTIEFYSIGQF